MSSATVFPKTSTTHACAGNHQAVARPRQSSSVACSSIASSNNIHLRPTQAPPAPSNRLTGAAILKSLLFAVRELHTAFSNRNVVATETDPCVCRVCDLLDSVLSHGLKQPPLTAHTAATALLQNVADRVAEVVSGAPFVQLQPSVTFWSFALPYLTSHERERFCTLQNVATDVGRGRALLRAALNERSLERYMLVWLNAPELQTSYEPWSALRVRETNTLLPSITADLATILFAVVVDNAALNSRLVGEESVAQRSEPIIVAPPPSRIVRAVPVRRRHLVSFGEDAELSDDASLVQGVVAIAGSPGRTLSSMCLKQPDAQGTLSSASAIQECAKKPDDITRPGPNAPSHQYEAVFGLLPELPSEIVEYGSTLLPQQTRTTPLKANESNNNSTAQFELYSEHDELADYLALESAAQEQRNRNNQRNSSSASTSSLEDDEANSTTSSSLRSANEAPMTQTISAHHGRITAALLNEGLLHMTERCTQLENRVAQLSL